MRVVRCPSCDTRYKIPDSAPGKRARCKRCGKHFLIPDPQPDSGKLALTSLEDLGGGQGAAPPAPATTPTAEEPTPAVLPMARAPDLANPAPAQSADAYSAYFRTLGRSFRLPFVADNLATFIVVGVLLCIRTFIGTYGGFFGSIGAILITGWYWSFLFGTVLNAAGGEEDLPKVTLTGGLMDDVFVPWMKMLLAYAIALAPIGVFLLLDLLLAGGNLTTSLFSGTGGVPQLRDIAGSAILLLLLMFGLFTWPMLLLVIAAGSMESVLRLDLIAATIFRSFGAYIIAVLAVYACVAVMIIAAVVMPETTGPVWIGAGAGRAAAQGAAFQLAMLYLTIFAMRAIGLHYHHFKHKYAWSWG